MFWVLEPSFFFPSFLPPMIQIVIFHDYDVVIKIRQQMNVVMVVCCRRKKDSSSRRSHKITENLPEAYATDGYRQ
jgi:hypothetical protein